MAILKQLFVIAERKNYKKISASLQTAGVHFENAVMARGIRPFKRAGSGFG